MHVHTIHIWILLFEFGFFLSRGQLNYSQENFNRDANMGSNGSSYSKEHLYVYPQQWPRTQDKTFCELPVDMGPCKRSLERWFYNMTSQRCEKFTYGGCGGGRNNFRSLEVCQSFCATIRAVMTSGSNTSQVSDTRWRQQDYASSNGSFGQITNPAANQGAVTYQNPSTNIPSDIRVDSRLSDQQQSKLNPDYSNTNQSYQNNNRVTGPEALNGSTMPFNQRPFQAIVNINIDFCKVPPCPRPTKENVTVTPSPSVTQSSLSTTSLSVNNTSSATTANTSAPVMSPQFTITITSTIYIPFPESISPQGPLVDTTNEFVVSLPTANVSSTIAVSSTTATLSTAAVLSATTVSSTATAPSTAATTTLSVSGPSVSITPSPSRSLISSITPTVTPTIQPNASCTEALDVGVIVDASESIKLPDYQTLLQLVVSLTNQFSVSEKGTHFGIIVYSSEAKLPIRFDEALYWNPQKLQEKILQLKWIGTGTRTDIALKLADKELFTPDSGDRPNKPNILIVITDGRTDPYRSEKYEVVLAPLKKKGVMTVAVGVGKDIGVEELKQIAQGDASKVFQTNTFGDLQTQLGSILKSSCQACKRPNDIGIVVDSSQSTKPDDFFRLKQFLVQFTDKFDVSPAATHFSLIGYSQEVGFYFNFSNTDFWNHKKLGETFRSLPWIGLQTRTDKALEYAQTIMFTAENGDRTDAPNTLIVVVFGRTEPKESQPYAATPKKESVKIVAVGVGPGVDRDELLLISNGNSSHIIDVDSTKNLDSFITPLLLLSCR